MSPQTHIYLPDDLLAQVRAAGIENISAVCQDALRAEVARRADRTAALAQQRAAVTEPVHDA